MTPQQQSTQIIVMTSLVAWRVRAASWPGWTGYLGARVDDGERRGDDEYPGSTVAEHECRGEYLERAEQPDANVERYDAVDGVDVFRQAINDAARWRRVVEGDGQTQHVGQTARVQ